MILEECQVPKDNSKKQMHFFDQAASLSTAGTPQMLQESQDALPEQDFEMSPSSPTLLLRNIEKQVKSEPSFWVGKGLYSIL